MRIRVASEHRMAVRTRYERMGRVGRMSKGCIVVERKGCMVEGGLALRPFRTVPRGREDSAKQQMLGRGVGANRRNSRRRTWRRELQAAKKVQQDVQGMSLGIRTR